VRLLEKLSRVTLSQKFIPEIDGLRFIAIFTVVLFHLRTQVLRLEPFDEKVLADNYFFSFLSRGGLGVNIFFTISGFVLAIPFIRQYVYGENKVNLLKYYVRRLTRLEPPYIIIMTLFFLMLVVLGYHSFADLFPHYLASLGYVHFFVYGTWSVINPVAWSLETEVQFYVLAPLIACVFLIRNSAVRISLVSICLFLHCMLVGYYFDFLFNYYLYKSVLFYLSNFLLGFLLADLYLLQRDRIKRKTYVSDVLGLIGFVSAYMFFDLNHWLNSFLFLIATLLIFVGVFGGKFLNHLFTRKVVTVIGGMCYTIYLIHYVILFLLVKPISTYVVNTSKLNFYTSYMVMLIIVIPILLVLSSIFFYYVEKPFMYPKWYNRKALKF